MSNRRKLRAWVLSRHDPRPGWQMYAADATYNGLTDQPSLEAKQAVLMALQRHTFALLDSTAQLNIGAHPMALCAVLADAGARLARDLTGTIFHVQSGRWCRVVGFEGGEVSYFERTGSDQDFHTWCVAALPNRRSIMFDPQAAFWDRPTLVWDDAETIFRTGIGWRAHSATTEKVKQLANDHRDLCDFLYLSTLQELIESDVIHPARIAS